MYIYRNVNFSSTVYDRVLILFVKIYLMNEHLLYKYFVSVSVSLATKEINVKICYNCWKVSWFLIFFSNFFSTFCLPYIFLIIIKIFATYGCRHPCLLLYIYIKLYVCFNVLTYFFCVKFSTASLLLGIIVIFSNFLLTSVHP